MVVDTIKTSLRFPISLAEKGRWRPSLTYAPKGS